MIWSVSTLLRFSGAATPVWVVNLSIVSLSFCGSGAGDGEVGQVGRRGEGAANGGRCGHRDGDQVGATALALAPLEVAVGGRGAALAGRELVGIHTQAHRAPGTTRSEEHTSELQSLMRISYAVFCLK